MLLQVLQSVTARLHSFVDQTLALSNAPALLGSVSRGKSFATSTVSVIY